MNDLQKKLPLSVRVIRATAAWLSANLRLAALIAGGAFLAGSLLLGIFAVSVDESASLQRFGRLVNDTVAPGLHLRIPWGVDNISKIKTGEVQRMEITGDMEKEISLLTGDENIIELLTVIQYRITGLGKYLFGSEAPEKIVTQCVRAALVGKVAAMHVDDVLTIGKADIQNHARTAAQKMLDAYSVGITLVAINLQTVNPPSEAAAAFRSVSDAKAEAEQAINDAEREREKVLNLAGGEAGKMIEEAQAGAQGRKQQAQGAAERFNHILAQKQKTPNLTRTDLYLDMVNKVLNKARVIVIAPGQKPNIELNIVEKSSGSKAKTDQEK